MKKYLFYAMRGEKMCFVHVLLNALELKSRGNEVKIIFEGQSVKLPAELSAESNPLYARALAEGLIAGVCLACSRVLGAEEDIKRLGLPFLSDMSGHAGIAPYAENGYIVLTF